MFFYTIKLCVLSFMLSVEFLKLTGVTGTKGNYADSDLLSTINISTNVVFNVSEGDANNERKYYFIYYFPFIYMISFTENTVVIRKNAWWFREPKQHVLRQR